MKKIVSTKIYRFIFSALLIALFVPGSLLAQNAVNHKFEIYFTPSAHQNPITGRIILVLSKSDKQEPRFQAGSYFLSAPFWGKDVHQLKPDDRAVIDTTVPGYPVDNLRDLPAGDYYVQAVMNVYTQFHRSDGHVIWAHMDHWEGQQFASSPGNLISKVEKIHYDPSRDQSFTVKLDSVLPPIKMPANTEQVKHIKIQSQILTKFWGHPMYLGATILLPKGYGTHTDAHYPVVYIQGHFNLRPPFGFTKKQSKEPPEEVALLKDYNLENGYQFYKDYDSAHFPRMILVTFQHPTPYYDDSYAVNSANNGPYGDAIMKELIPYIETHYRIIRKPYARVLTGGSTGGWESLALQIYHPDFFNGTWTLYPDPLDFRRFQMINLYQDNNAFYTKKLDWGYGRNQFNRNSNWLPTLRYMSRDNEGQPIRTVKDMSRMEAVLGSHERSGQQFDIFDAVFGPVGKDGYPEPLWNKLTGEINHDAVDYARDHGFDLRYYTAKHWHELGPKLEGKIHVYVGDGDNYYLNLAVYKFHDFLEHTKDPHYAGTFKFGRPMKGHGWEPVDQAELLRMMAKRITDTAPKGADTKMWNY